MLWESSKNQFGPPKKKGRQNFGKFFENPPPPPLEKILDPPWLVVLNFCSYFKVFLLQFILPEQPVLFKIHASLIGIMIFPKTRSGLDLVWKIFERSCESCDFENGTHPIFYLFRPNLYSL